MTDANNEQPAELQEELDAAEATLSDWASRPTAIPPTSYAAIDRLGRLLAFDRVLGRYGGHFADMEARAQACLIAAYKLGREDAG